MARPIKLACVSALVLASAGFATACGTQKISVPTANRTAHDGAVLFSQRCAGCHTLSYAATHGSAANVRTAQPNNGPNFNVRCERPVTRVLYAIENGGFSGAIMPQNVVVGADAVDVAKFVATYAGRQATVLPGGVACSNQPIGTITAASATPAPTTSSTTSTTATTAAAAPKKSTANKSKKKKSKKKKS